MNHFAISFACFARKHDIPAWHDLQFSQPRKCSSAVASAVHSALPDGALRVQEHAPGSALHGPPCVWEHVFPRHEGGEIFRCLQKVSLFRKIGLL